MVCVHKGLGLGNHLAGEKDEGPMNAFYVNEFHAMYLKLGGDDAPDVGVNENSYEDDEEEDDVAQAQEQGEPSAPHDGLTSMDWEASQAFHRQLHDEQMAYLRA
nr:hypothetical protein Iba_chr14aCG5530 [Ipomoea batatas]GMD88204.1 hypothetical protein Iba_chr14cCG4830 [Ipomoea batatas]